MKTIKKKKPKGTNFVADSHVTCSIDIFQSRYLSRKPTCIVAVREREKRVNARKTSAYIAERRTLKRERKGGKGEEGKREREREREREKES